MFMKSLEKNLFCSNINEFYNKLGTENAEEFVLESYMEKKKQELQSRKKYWKLFLLKFNKIRYLKKIQSKPIMLNNTLYDYAADVFKNKQEYCELYNLLSDEISKKTLLDVLAYKVTFDRGYLDLNMRPTQDQYLDSKIMKFTDREVVVDCGGYIGDNALTFFKYAKSASKYYLLEPDCNNLEHAKRILAEEPYNNIEYCLLATGSENKTVCFSSNGAGGNINNVGEIEIQMIKLDDFVKEPISFIKMDIEGCEIDTLTGAFNQIKQNKPKLAICAYHKPDDLWKITKKVLSTRNDYKVFLRLYLSTFCETVLYFV